MGIVEQPIFKTICGQRLYLANSPARYRIAAVAGQNLDIQLVPTTPQGNDPRSTIPTSPTATLDPAAGSQPTQLPNLKPKNRSEERRVGKEC